MKYPEFLGDNGSIGFPAPSFGCATEPYKSLFISALAKFREMGYLCYPGTNSELAEGVGISNAPQGCAGELYAMYCDNDIDTLISCGGGELMCEILEYVDWDRIRASKPKWFMGYSDNTNFSFLLNTLCDTASIYAPCVSNFGMSKWHPSVDDAMALLAGKKLKFNSYDLWEKESVKDELNPYAPYNVTEKRQHVIFDGTSDKYVSDEDKISFEGRLIGGCLDCLSNLVGTEFDKVKEFSEKYASDGIIWALEACDLNVFSIRRAMWQLEHAGWFNHVKGFLIGRPLNGESMFNLDRYEAVLNIAGKKGVPVIMDIDMGHLPPMIPMMMGSVCKVEAQNNEMTLEYFLK